MWTEKFRKFSVKGITGMIRKRQTIKQKFDEVEVLTAANIKREAKWPLFLYAKLVEKLGKGS